MAHIHSLTWEVVRDRSLMLTTFLKPMRWLNLLVLRQQVLMGYTSHFTTNLWVHKLKATKLSVCFNGVFKSQSYCFKVDPRPSLKACFWFLFLLDGKSHIGLKDLPGILLSYNANPALKRPALSDWLFSLLTIKDTRAPTPHLDHKLNTTWHSASRKKENQNGPNPLKPVFSSFHSKHTCTEWGQRQIKTHALWISLPVNNANLYSDSKMLRGPVHAALLDLHSHESLITIQ